MLSNEQLFELIQNGNEDLKPVLWERVKKWLHKLCNDFYRHNKDMCLNRGIEAQDIKQMSYIAYLSFLTAYSTDKRYSVLTALKYALYNELRANLGSGTDVLNRIKQSLSEPIGEEDGCTLEELIADEGSTEPFENIEDKAEHDTLSVTLKEEIEKLPEREQVVIVGKYYRNKNYTELSKEMQLSGQRVAQIHKEAIKHLQKPHVIERIQSDIHYIRRLQNDLSYTSSRMYGGRKANAVDILATERVYLESLLSDYAQAYAAI